MTPKNCRVLAYSLNMNFVDEMLHALPIRHLPVLHHEDGAPCLDAPDRSIVVSVIFAKLEAGCFTTMPEMLQSCIQRQQVATCRTTHRELLASRLELEQAFRARKRGRAMGESGLPGELFACFCSDGLAVVQSVYQSHSICAGTISN